MNSFICLLPVLLPMAAGAFILLTRHRRGDVLACVAAVLTAFSLVPSVMMGTSLDFEVTYTLYIIMRADKLGVFFLTVISAGFIAALIYACEYLSHDKRRHIFFGFSLMTMGAMLGLAMAGNLVTFYMFYELMSLLSFPLVLYSGGEKASRAAMKYLMFSVFGASMALMGMMLGGGMTMHDFAVSVGHLSLSTKQLWAFAMIALGFSCKAGMMPLANWLPTAHPVAPAPASALLSGIITKAGILGIARAAFYVFGGGNLAGTWPQVLMLALSIVTIFCGSMLAYKEELMKKRLAYSSVSQLSYVIFGMMLCSEAGFVGAMLQVLFHARAKVGLFLCAGGFIHHAEAEYVSDLTGMGLRMPKVMAAFTCFSLSLVGIPPFGGFVSKWQLALAALADGSFLAEAGVVVLMVSALLTAGYLLPIVSRGYFPGEGYKAKNCDGGAAMTVPLFALAAAAAAFGILPSFVCDYFGTIAAWLF
ncbi:MAG: proton-conducting membrane transporter [Clostridia bacterium]|nr:proton-conducting membrane transporter [Clostridia bacterium]